MTKRVFYEAVCPTCGEPLEVSFIEMFTAPCYINPDTNELRYDSGEFTMLTQTKPYAICSVRCEGHEVVSNGVPASEWITDDLKPTYRI